MAENSAAKELLMLAKNRLNKFYNPKLYKPAPKAELSAEDRIFTAEGGTVLAEVSKHGHTDGVAPPPPPETFGPYTKAPENAGVIDMINLLITELEKDTTEAK